MKALASEIVQKLSKRLKWLSIQVRELTGDMQMTKAEIAATQIIVTTPEKWDVVTRKPTGEGELVSTLRLLIIDEVHLLNEDRGAVIEAIVARTLRQVESSQSVIRIVGLSATLPNYVDVAEFLSVSKQKGLFYFDSSFRPIPLEQHFIGIKGKAGSPQSRTNLDRVTFQKVAELVGRGHQVMVFVHARKDTVKTAMALKELAIAEGSIDDFSCESHPQWSLFRRQIGESKNKEMKQLFDSGFGIHHAGMLRTDRNMTERVFQERAIKVLCCTATLAWGVNLPAHAVIIKGTQIYDSAKGKFEDLSVLDVLQIFGRAGRPGLEDSGEGYICTTEDKLTHYLEAVTSQIPIESKFSASVTDALNAEIALGTVASVTDGVRWLSYTYLYVRMRKNPFVYGISGDELVDDPQLRQRRNDMVITAARQLADAGMITIDTGDTLFITDLGRIAARYYISYQSVEIFNSEFRHTMSEADVLRMLSMSTEFDQIQIRESEIKELEQLMKRIPCEVMKPDTKNLRAPTPNSLRVPTQEADTTQEVIDSKAKVNILLQGFISLCQVEDFALVSDTMYVAQNGGRICRALLEIAMSRKWANVTAVVMGLCKAIEKRLWPYEHPLLQFDLKPDVRYGLETWANDWTPAQLAASSAQELGELVHLNKYHGQALLNAAQHFPVLELDYCLRPLASDVLKIIIKLRPAFKWNSKHHGNSEPFWLWVEDQDGLNIIQMTYILLRQDTVDVTTNFFISAPDGQRPPYLIIRYLSDRWLGADDEWQISWDTLSMPKSFRHHTVALTIPLLTPSVLGDELIETTFVEHLRSFNPMQSQVIWSLLNTQSNFLLCAPAGSGSTVLAQALIWKSLRRGGLILVVVPRKSFAITTISYMRPKSGIFGATIELATGSKIWQPCKNPTTRFVVAKDLYASLCQRSPLLPSFDINLVILDHLEELDVVYELAISLLLHATQLRATRLVGFSRSLCDPSDLVAWLHIEPASLFSFKPSDRNQALTVTVQPLTSPTSTSLNTMIKPTDSAIQAESQAIVFVPSRGHCRSVALGLITQRTLESETARGYLPTEISDLRAEECVLRLHDKSLTDLVSKGVGLFHGGLHAADRVLMIELFIDSFLRVLIVPHESCWALPVRAPLVVVMGTQWIDHSRQIRDYELQELVQMQSCAVRHAATGHLLVFCHSESKDTILHFLNEGLPLESKLLETPDLLSWYRYQQEQGYLPNKKQDFADFLSFTFLSHRIRSNPAYYDCVTSNRDENLSRFIDKLTSTV